MAKILVIDHREEWRTRHKAALKNKGEIHFHESPEDVKKMTGEDFFDCIKTFDVHILLFDASNPSFAKGVLKDALNDSNKRVAFIGPEGSDDKQIKENCQAMGAEYLGNCIPKDFLTKIK